ncbi:hypothetical protein AB0D86_35945, partial [Streptomyces sp. NPDC048324]
PSTNAPGGDNRKPPRSPPETRSPDSTKLGAAQSLANLTKHSLDQLTALVKTRLKRMQYRPGLIEGLIAKTGLDLQPLTSTKTA